MIFRVDFKTVEAEESRPLSRGSFLLLLRVLDLCYALGEGGVMTITDGLRVLDLCYALGEPVRESIHHI